MGTIQPARSRLLAATLITVAVIAGFLTGGSLGFELTYVLQEHIVAKTLWGFLTFALIVIACAVGGGALGYKLTRGLADRSEHL